MRRAMLAVLVLVLLTAAACGGGGDDKKDSSSGTTTSVLTRSESGNGSGAGAGALNGVSKKCRDAAVAYGNALASVSQAITGNSKQFESSSKQFQDFVDQAPSDIKKDMQTVATAWADYVKDLKDAGIDTSSSGKAPTPAQIAKLQRAAQSLQDSDFTAASQRVQQWFAKECAA